MVDHYVFDDQTQTEPSILQTQRRNHFLSLSLLSFSLFLIDSNDPFQPPQTEIDLLFDLHHLDQPIEFVFLLLHYLLVLIVDQSRNDFV
jgi:hypothetical protein